MGPQGYSCPPDTYETVAEATEARDRLHLGMRDNMPAFFSPSRPGLPLHHSPFSSPRHTSLSPSFLPSSTLRHESHCLFPPVEKKGGGHRTETGERLTCRRLRCGWCPLSVRSITTCHPPVAEHARPPIAGRGRVRRRWLPALHNTQADEFSTPRHNSHNSSVIGFRSLVNAPHESNCPFSSPGWEFGAEMSIVRRRFFFALTRSCGLIHLHTVCP